MQASQLKTLIETYGAALATSGAAEAGTRMGLLAEAVGKAGSQTVAKFLGAIEKAGLDSISGTGPQIGDVAPPVEKLMAILTEAGAKKAVVTDLELLLDLLRRRSEVSLVDFDSCALRSVASASRRKADPGAPPVDTKQLVENYLQRLEAALGNEGMFRAVFRELSADKSVTRVEAVEIASRFLEPMAQSATRPKALQKILCRHEKLLDSRNASKAIGSNKAA